MALAAAVHSFEPRIPSMLTLLQNTSSAKHVSVPMYKQHMVCRDVSDINIGNVSATRLNTGELDTPHIAMAMDVDARTRPLGVAIGSCGCKHR